MTGSVTQVLRVFVDVRLGAPLVVPVVSACSPTGPERTLEEIHGVVPDLGFHSQSTSGTIARGKSVELPPTMLPEHAPARLPPP